MKIFNGGSTRLYMTIMMIGLALIEGLIKQFLTNFPLTEVFSLQGIVFGGYMTVKTMSNMDEAKERIANGGGNHVNSLDD